MRYPVDVKIVIDKLDRLDKKAVDIISSNKSGWALYKNIAMAKDHLKAGSKSREEDRVHGIC